MSSDVVIRAEGLSKKYLIGHQAVGRRYATLRDAIGRVTRGVARATSDMWHGRQIVAGDTVEELWALKDINFEIKRGEALGIIGRNGAGKSTLLKVLSRITDPSEGRVEIKGRVASLLEVGTGFHPELTGRENIFLNGAILGMRRTEIRRRFDEIVAFANIDKFVDTPVKRYSSGMYVRLAFAVAAHLEPDILVVDEVLSVGDAAFQKKCLGKMSEVARGGRTVLFVSHQLGTISRLCESAMLLSSGQVTAQGPARDVLDVYRRDIEVDAVTERKIRQELYISQIATMNDDGEPASEYFFDEEITVRVTLNGPVKEPQTMLTTTLVSHQGHYVSTFVTVLNGLVHPEAKTHQVAVIFPRNVIAPNSYNFRIALSVAPATVVDLCENVAEIRIRDSGSAMAAYEGVGYGDVILPCRSMIWRSSH